MSEAGKRKREKGKWKSVTEADRGPVGLQAQPRPGLARFSLVPFSFSHFPASLGAIALTPALG
jgi:hypothetical protein